MSTPFEHTGPRTREPKWKPEYACVCCGMYPGSRTLRFVVLNPLEPSAGLPSLRRLMLPLDDVYEVGQFCSGCFDYWMRNSNRHDWFFKMDKAWNLRRVY